MKIDVNKYLTHDFERLAQVPRISKLAHVFDGAKVIGDVEIGDYSSIWFNSVLRGDVESIRIGKNSNIQDLSMLHVTTSLCPCVVGDNVTVGHGVILHGCKVANNVIVGMGSILLDEVEIGEQVIIGAGTLLTPGKKIPAFSKVMGSPGKVVGTLNEAEINFIQISANHYQNLMKAHVNSVGG